MNGNLQVEDIKGALAIGTKSASCPGNSINGNLQVTNNTGAIEVFNDVAKGNLQCQGNSSITGGGDKANSLQGQCAGF